MGLIDTVVRVDARSVETRSKIDENRAKLFGVKSKVESYIGIELIAQSAAMPLIYNAKEGEGHAGVIAQVRSFRSYSPAIEDYPILTTRCEVELMLDGKVASVKGAVFFGEVPVCEAVLTLAIQGG